MHRTVWMDRTVWTRKTVCARVGANSPPPRASGSGRKRYPQDR